MISHWLCRGNGSLHGHKIVNGVSWEPNRYGQVTLD